MTERKIETHIYPACITDGVPLKFAPNGGEFLGAPDKGKTFVAEVVLTQKAGQPNCRDFQAIANGDFQLSDFRAGARN